jgi:hypothetical protein
MYSNISENEAVEYIKQIVLIYFDAPENYYETKTRKHEVLKIKQFACYFAKRHTCLPNQVLAEMFNFKNHSSVISLVRKIDNCALFDKNWKRELKEIETIIRLKGLTKDLKIDFDKHYYINMNDFKSVRENFEKAIVFVGYTDEEIFEFLKNKRESKFPIVNHTHTKKYILQDKLKENE